MVLLWIGLVLVLVDDDDDDLCAQFVGVYCVWVCLQVKAGVLGMCFDVCFLPHMIYFDGNLGYEKGTLCIGVLCFDFFWGGFVK